MLKTGELRIAAGTVWTAITAFELLRRELQSDPLQTEAEEVLVALIHMRQRVLERIPHERERVLRKARGIR